MRNSHMSAMRKKSISIEQSHCRFSNLTFFVIERILDRPLNHSLPFNAFYFDHSIAGVKGEIIRNSIQRLFNGCKVLFFQLYVDFFFIEINKKPRIFHQMS